MTVLEGIRAFLRAQEGPVSLRKLRDYVQGYHGEPDDSPERWELVVNWLCEFLEGRDPTQWEGRPRRRRGRDGTRVRWVPYPAGTEQKAVPSRAGTRRRRVPPNEASRPPVLIDVTDPVVREAVRIAAEGVEPEPRPKPRVEAGVEKKLFQVRPPQVVPVRNRRTGFKLT